MAFLHSKRSGPRGAFSARCKPRFTPPLFYKNRHRNLWQQNNCCMDTISKTFKSGYFFRLIRKDYNPFTPDIITIDDQTIYHKRRRWYLLSTNYQKYHFQSIIGFDVRTELFGADLVIDTNGSSAIHIRGFSKSNAKRISAVCSELIIKNAPRNIIDSLNSSLNKLTQSKDLPNSIADELVKLKRLLDDNSITQDEFDKLKQKFFNS